MKERPKRATDHLWHIQRIRLEAARHKAEQALGEYIEEARPYIVPIDWPAKGAMN